MNAALIMENVHRTVTIHMEATTVLVIVDTYSQPTRRIVMVRTYNNLCSFCVTIGISCVVTLLINLFDTVCY